MTRNETDGLQRNQRRGAVLLTGATGFVGGELLRRLIADDPRPIVCLVRAESNPEAKTRGLSALATVLGRFPTPHEQARVTWLAGDLTQPSLGLHSDRWWRLAQEVEEIFHCAASTRFDLPLEDAQLANVRGVEEIYELAYAAVDAGRFRRLNHVSTAYAAGRTSARVHADHLPPDRAGAFRNTYERTKARAERMLRAQSRVPFTIYRPSIIVGDSRDGHTSSWNVVYFPMRLMASSQLPFAPRGGRALLDCVPVDYVADAILALAGRRDTVNRAFHLTSGEEAMTVDQVVSRRSGSRISRTIRSASSEASTTRSGCRTSRAPSPVCAPMRRRRPDTARTGSARDPRTSPPWSVAGPSPSRPSRMTENAMCPPLLASRRSRSGAAREGATMNLERIFRLVASRPRATLALGITLIAAPAAFLPALTKDTRNDAFARPDDTTIRRS